MHPPQYVDFGGCAIAYPPYKSRLAKVLNKEVPKFL